MLTHQRHDWTLVEKLHFEDVAIEFIQTMPVKYQTHKHFDNWLLLRHPDFLDSADIVWSYVLAN